MATRYAAFVDAFGKLSPFQLHHMIEVLLAKIESRMEGRLIVQSTGNVFDEGDLKMAFVDTMKTIVGELYKLPQQETQLAQTLYEIIANNLLMT
jgi:hypothetical protein